MVRYLLEKAIYVSVSIAHVFLSEIIVFVIIMLLFQVCYYFTFFGYASNIIVNDSGLQQRHTCERGICGSWILQILLIL